MGLYKQTKTYKKMITYKVGNIFDSGTEAIVNPVNCVGVMGGGLALQFKNRYEGNFDIYKLACDEKILTVGTVLLVEIVEIEGENHPKYIANFPTKDHFMNPSEMSYIEDGLDYIIELIIEKDIKSIAFPALGCGLGGLEWEDVQPIMESKLSVLKDVDVVIYQPN